MTLKQITDDELWNKTAALAQEERKITLDVLLHLREIERRGLHLRRGFPSLYEYAVRELKYAEGAAYRRVQAMRLLRDLPEAEEKIETGELNLTTAAKIQNTCRTMTKDQKQALLVEVQGKGSREVDRKISSLLPSSARENARWLSPEEVQLKIILDKASFGSLEGLKAIKSHTKSSYGEVVKELITLGTQKWNPLQRTAPPQRWSTAKSPNPRYIPSALRVEVWKRDGGQCTYADPKTGRRCEARHFLQVDHIRPVALGGKSELGNLRLLCGTHNRLRAAETFRPAP